MATRKPPSEVEVTRFVGVLLSMMGSVKGTREGKMTENHKLGKYRQPWGHEAKN